MQQTLTEDDVFRKIKWRDLKKNRLNIRQKNMTTVSRSRDLLTKVNKVYMRNTGSPEYMQFTAQLYRTIIYFQSKSKAKVIYNAHVL